MKAIIKLFFALAIVFTCAKVINNSQDPLVTFTFIGIAFAVLTGFIVPVSYIKTHGTLGVLDITVWKNYIIEKLRRNNAFIFKSKDDTRFVLGGLTVVIPQSGGDPVILIDNASWPLTPTRRTDTDVSYNLQAFSTNPHHIPWQEIQTLSYNKIDSILGSHTNSLVEAVADAMLIKWSPTVAGKILSTTGGPNTLTQDPASGQTGNRFLFHPKDLLRGMTAMNIDDVPDSGRIAVIDDNMYGGFYDQLSDSQANAYNQFANNETGQVGKLHGFNIYRRSKVLAYADAATSANAYGASLAATDNLACLLYHQDTVCRAFGEMKPFMDKDNPLYQGDIMSMIVRAGGRKERGDNKGVIAMVQAAA